MALAKIYEEPHADLFPLHLFVESWAWRLADKAGENLQSICAVFQNHGTQWFTEEEEQTCIAKELLKRMTAGSFEQVRDSTSNLLKQMQERSRKLEAADFASMETAGLLKEYRDYCDAVIELNSWGMLVTLMEMGPESVITQECFAYLLKKAVAVGCPQLVGESVATLCAPVEGTFLREKKIGALRAAILAREFGLDSPQVKKAIANLHRDYCWVSYGYIGPQLSLQDFRKEVEGLAFGKGGLQEELDAALNEDRRTIAKQRELEAKFKLDGYGRRLFELARTFAFQKELRKQVLYRSFKALLPLRQELARRANLDAELAAYVLPQELDDMLSGKLGAKVLQERMALCVYLPFPRRILVGKEAKDFVSSIQERKPDSNQRELKGQGAYSAPAVEGTARLVFNAHDLHKLKPGDILVSPATSPVMVPSMKAVAAIVTDQGGLTCHAAIVSRELQVPCVIGTAIATKVIKDGERLLVDSANGVVRRLD